LSNDLLLQKWQTEFKKGFSKPLILFTLAEVGRSYAYLLTKKILELTNGEISIAGSNIYPMLTKLEMDDLLVSKLDENDRKFYELSASGKEFLRQLGLSMKNFNQIMLELIEKSENKGDQ
jgi:DNA-binding PadR family transcriptional regulator